MTLHVMIPLRSPGVGKSRLASHLSPDGRARVAAAMLADVVSAVREAGLGDPTILASGPAAAAAGGALGCPILVDPPSGGLNRTIEAAVDALLPSDDVLVLLADLPLVMPADVTAIAEDRALIVMAPTSDGGTSALLRRPGTAMGTRFGPDSANRHLNLAHGLGLDVAVLQRTGLGVDLDTMSDLANLDVDTVGPALATVLWDLFGK